ncbi:LPS export ABC transporter periplasmic protein LptC [Ahrensia kielensis]|uniref:LPS export ABC transporter periplasmic protein LptC n=1 Tax=Ahrensia kielensis TaxID=76980 RepID=UPI00036022D2|nr:LPS export ABC transporter periplasmic protein LptC [Ahrensia kielensis]
MSKVVAKAASNDAFERARRHSTKVRVFKRLLPIIALIGVVFVGGILFISRIVPDGSVDLASSTISDGKLVMASPKLNGMTKDKRPYRVTASRAIQDLSGETAMQLEKLVAKVELENGAEAELSAPTGSFDDQKSTLLLDQQAVLTTSDGMRAVLGRADIDLASGNVSAKDKVAITQELTTIYSDKMDVYDGGKRIVFSDNVTLVMQPSVVSKDSQNMATAQEDVSAIDTN